MPTVNIPILQDIPILGKILSGHNILTYFAFICVLLVWILLYKTPMGLQIRAVGESPNAALQQLFQLQFIVTQGTFGDQQLIFVTAYL